MGNSHLQIALKEDPGTTGNFEVTLNGTLIHSKKTGGKGRCQDPREREAIFAEVRKALEAAGVAIPAPDPKAQAAAGEGGCMLL